MRTITLFLILSFFIISSGCKKKNDDPTPSNSITACSISEIDFQGGNKAVYSYDSNHRIIESKGYDSKGKLTVRETYSYSSGQILYSNFDSTSSSPSTSGTLYMGTNGFVEKEILITTGIIDNSGTMIIYTINDTVKYTYDNNGYLLSEVDEYIYNYSNGDYDSSITTTDYTWENGNNTVMVKTFTHYNKDGSLNSNSSYTTYYTYSDKVAKTEINTDFGLYGNPSKNLVYTSEGNGSKGTIAYTFDSNGNVVSKTNNATIISGNYYAPFTINYKYSCY